MMRISIQSEDGSGILSFEYPSLKLKVKDTQTIRQIDKRC